MHKRRDMYMVDIYGSFLTVDMDEEVIVLLWGRISELMVNTELSIYQNFVTIENEHMVLYFKL